LDSLNPAFLSFYLSLDWGGQSQISRAQHGQIKPGLNLEHISDLPFPFPLQQEFGRLVAAIENLKASHRTLLAEMDTLFASLQDRAFRGEL
jgi:type I restriction enzyme, S subunit